MRMRNGDTQVICTYNRKNQGQGIGPVQQNPRYQLTIWQGERDEQGYGHLTCYTGGNTGIYDVYHVQSSDVLTGIETPQILTVIEYALSQNYPNPFQTKTNIHYQLPKSSHVTIAIYDVSGQKVKTLVNEPKNAGFYTIQWNGQSQDNQRVSNGIYFCRMKAGEYTSVKKILLMR